MSTQLYCNYEELTKLPNLSDNLIDLFCGGNCLTTLPKRLPEHLVTISCHRNRLTKLPEHLPNTLKYLYCWNNRFITLPEHLPNTLTLLLCYVNYFTKLPKQLPNLTNFDFSDNPFCFNIFQVLTNTNITSYNNYKVLVKIQVNRINGKISYFCRDINRLCNSY